MLRPALLIIYFFFFFLGCTNGDNFLESNSSIKYGQNLTSIYGRFTLGFFVRGSNAYLGTWYTTHPMVIVWVANRDSPIPLQLLHNCSLVMGDDGNAKLFDYSKNLSYWSTASNPANIDSLRISDDGNLELIDGDIFWESFDNPTDTFLPGMDISQGGFALTSWKTPQDPSKGDYSFLMIQGVGSYELVMYNLSQSSTTPYWSSSFSSLHPFLVHMIQGVGSYELVMYNLSGSQMRLVMNATGSLQLWELDEDSEKWSMLWVAPKDQCDFYDPCGTYGVCDAGNSVRCKCLPGYHPNAPVEWESGDFSRGCSKETNNLCSDKSLRLDKMKLPPHQEIISSSPRNESEKECGNQCARDCGCKAYSFDPDQSSCLVWRNDLSTVEEDYYNANASAHTLYIRINHLDIESGSRTCNICGTNVIPYPLSTKPGCGDPNYLSFECNATNGQLYFKPPSGRAYKVSHINPNQRMFTLQLVAPTSVLTDYKCEASNDIALKAFNLRDSSVFIVTKCSIVQLMDKKVVEVDVSWRPPLPPACNSSEDCKDWPETTCSWGADGKKVCVCGNGFHWNFLNMNCTKDDHHKHMPLMLKVGTACATGVFLLIGISFVIHLRRRRVKHRADQFRTDEIEDIDIPFVDYHTIKVATNNFSDANKLGAGGFGPVYKGLLADGNEVAVKTLSATSEQGAQEFRNEIIVIAKLQHRNLVRVLGYCIKEEEKILIYEYMPNKCLDSFLFNQAVSPLLDWTTRFNIILGIARGLLYLHQDSRLRIIHRDLKPSNILLDKELNPKISDFGLAKIVAGNEMAAKTARVIGTRGYMSPEYVLDGYFSIESDVYSFGIIIFEVISGRRCTSWRQLDNNLVSLLGYAWALWNKGEDLELVDKMIVDTCDSIEVKRCINVAFLCVQEYPRDRPPMSSALLMLGGERINLPCPKQPVFVPRRQPLGPASSSGANSNVLTTTIEGR